MDDQRNRDAGPAVAPRRVPTDPSYAPSHLRPPLQQPSPDQPRPMRPEPDLIVQDDRSVDQAKRGQGVRDVVGGLVLIGIGFMWGSSVFLGNPTALDWFFDGLGTFWFCKGLFNIFTA